MVCMYRLCLTLFESNTNVIHGMFLFTLSSRNCKNSWVLKLEKEREKWNKVADHQLDTIKCYLWSWYDSMAFFTGTTYPWAFFCSGNFACFSFSLLCPILNVQSLLNCWALLSSTGFSRAGMPFALHWGLPNFTELGQIINCCQTRSNVKEVASGSSSAGYTLGFLNA